MADADADAAAPAPDPTLEADLRTTAALRAVLEAREADEMARLVQELQLRPIVEDAILVGARAGDVRGDSLIPRSNAPWFFGLLDHYGTLVKTGETVIKRSVVRSPLPFHQLQCLARRMNGERHADFGDSWPAQALYFYGCNAEGLRDHRTFCTEVLEMTLTEDYFEDELEFGDWFADNIDVWEPKLNRKIFEMLYLDIASYRVTDEQLAAMEADGKWNYRICATVKWDPCSAPLR